MGIPFSRATPVGREREYIDEALAAGNLAGGGKFSRLCESWLETHLGVRHALLTPSCTAALEMAALLLGLAPGDEVIMPSFTFASTANAFVLRGAIPVFVDIRDDTLNINEAEVAGAITPRTKAIVVVHYAGEACAMDAIGRIAARYGISVIEDAAQALLSRYRDRALGTIGRFGCISFHTTKNVSSGHGGAFLANDDADFARAEIVRDRGTDRSQFLRGERPKYSWIDAGSSFFLSEISAAYLFAQLEHAETVTRRRLEICAAYRKGLAPLATEGIIRLPLVVPRQSGNGHIFYFLTRGPTVRGRLLCELKRQGIDAAFHYTPLHSSPAGRRFGRAVGELANTESVSQGIVRLPLFAAMKDDQVQSVIDAIVGFYAK